MSSDGRDRDAEILEEIAAIADGSQSRVARLCTAAARILDAAGASISLFAEGGRRDICASDDVIAELDELQYTLDEGPCIEAFSTGRPVRMLDLRDEDDLRWPGFTEKALDLGAESVFAFPLRDGGPRIGTLNLYRTEAGDLRDDDAWRTVAGFVSTVILELQMSSPSDELNAGLGEMTAWDSIHQAAGKTAERCDVRVDVALDGMRAMAASTSTRLSELAADILEGEIDPSHIIEQTRGDRGHGH